MNIVTYFDRSYLVRGLVFLNSLFQHEPESKAFVLCLDNETEQALKDRPNIITTPLRILEHSYPKLIQLRAERTWQEFCWSITPAFCLEAMVRYDLDHILYMDADNFVMNSLAPFWREVKEHSIAIIPHRFTPGRERYQNGIYNVNGVWIRNTLTGLTCLTTWQKQCFQWCYARCENGKFGDQKYLDGWVEEYNAHIVELLGANLAPWCQMQYEYCFDKWLYVIARDSEGNVRRIDPVLFYHAHEFQHHVDGSMIRRTNWDLHPDVVKYIYQPYEQRIKETAHRVKG